jgi:hypothetical protein
MFLLSDIRTIDRLLVGQLNSMVFTLKTIFLPDSFLQQQNKHFSCQKRTKKTELKSPALIFNLNPEASQ